MDGNNVSCRVLLGSLFVAMAVLLTGCTGAGAPGVPLAGDYTTTDPTASEPAAFTWPKGKRAAVSLTFDDARASQLINGIPILAKHGIRVTFYVSTWGVEGHEDGWRKAIAVGHEIGNHSLTHPCSVNYEFSRPNALEDYTLGRMEKDILAANTFIERTLGVRPKTFAYPCGQMFVGRGRDCQSYVPLVAKHFTAGRRAYSRTFNQPALSDLARLAAVDIDVGGLPRLKKLVDQTVAGGGWLILAGHEITTDAKDGLPADTLDALCRYMLGPDKGVWVDTVGNIATYVTNARNEGGKE
jgi:hypothetical protein